MKTIAKNEFEVVEVLNNLPQEEKIKRLKYWYSIQEILEILGFYDGSMSKKDQMKITDTEEEFERPKAIYLMAINNGNFEEVIAKNYRA